MKPDGQECATCLCFEPSLVLSTRASGRAVDGECRGRQPHSVHGWPEVAATDWCAQWRRPTGQVPPAPNQSEIQVNPAMLEGPHSRACGWQPHAHGSACHSNCPTCHGR